VFDHVLMPSRGTFPSVTDVLDITLAILGGVLILYLGYVLVTRNES